MFLSCKYGVQLLEAFAVVGSLIPVLYMEVGSLECLAVGFALCSTECHEDLSDMICGSLG